MARRKWLADDEQRAWTGLIASMSLLDSALDHQLQRDAGLSHAQYAVLARLSMAAGRTMHMSELAALTSSSTSRLSHAVARMEEADLVTRSRCPDNRRAVHATLTEQGVRLVRAAAPGHVAEVRRLLFDQLNPSQVGQLAEITSALLGALAADGHVVPTW